MRCSNGTKVNRNGDVDVDHIIEESPDDLLEKADGLWKKRGGLVKIVRVLDFGAIDRLRPGVGGSLSVFGVRILELAQCFVDVSWHRDVESPVGVIPCKGEAAEKRSGIVDGDSVQAAECGDGMVRGGIAGVLDSKIIDDQREHNGQVGVCLERRHAGDGGIAVLGEMQSEAVVDDDARLLEAGHNFSDFEVDPAVRGKRKNVVMHNNLVRDRVDGQTHVLVAVHGRIITENFNV